jgi:hypothetical protein
LYTYGFKRTKREPPGINNLTDNEIEIWWYHICFVRGASYDQLQQIKTISSTNISQEDNNNKSLKRKVSSSSSSSTTTASTSSSLPDDYPIDKTQWSSINLTELVNTSYSSFLSSIELVDNTSTTITSLKNDDQVKKKIRISNSRSYVFQSRSPYTTITTTTSSLSSTTTLPSSSSSSSSSLVSQPLLSISLPPPVTYLQSTLPPTELLTLPPVLLSTLSQTPTQTTDTFSLRTKELVEEPTNEDSTNDAFENLLKYLPDTINSDLETDLSKDFLSFF